jgi:hypothetical protein
MAGMGRFLEADWPLKPAHSAKEFVIFGAAEVSF